MENVKFVKIRVLNEEHQLSILRKVSNFHVSVDKFSSKDGANPTKTAVDMLFWDSTTSHVDKYKKKNRHFTPNLSMFAWLFHPVIWNKFIEVRRTFIQVSDTFSAITRSWKETEENLKVWWNLKDFYIKVSLVCIFNFFLL